MAFENPLTLGHSKSGFWIPIVYSKDPNIGTWLIGFFFLSSLYTAAWVTFNGVVRLQPGLFCASHSTLLVLRVIFASSLDAFLASLFLSLSQLTSLESSLFFVALSASDRVHFRARPFARQWSFVGGRSCFVSNSKFLAFQS